MWYVYFGLMIFNFTALYCLRRWTKFLSDADVIGTCVCSFIPVLNLAPIIVFILSAIIYYCTNSKTFPKIEVLLTKKIFKQGK